MFIKLGSRCLHSLLIPFHALRPTVQVPTSPHFKCVQIIPFFNMLGSAVGLFLIVLMWFDRPADESAQSLTKVCGDICCGCFQTMNMCE